MRFAKLLVMLLCSLCLVACTSQRVSTKSLPKGVGLKKGLQIPNTTRVRYYLPHHALTSRFFISEGGFWIEPGKGLTEGSKAAFNAYFPDSQLLELNKDEGYGLLVDLQPSWDFEKGKVIAKLSYRVLDGDLAQPLFSGERKFAAAFDYAGSGNAAFYNAYMRAAQLVIVDVLNTLEPSSEKFPSDNSVAEVKPETLVNFDQPVSLGTGFYFNAGGQLLTANHVLDECLVVRVQGEGDVLEAKIGANSPLLDLAVLETNAKSDHYLPLRENQEVILGEMVSSVGYPLQGLLAETPSLTRGNISARSGMKGSLGLLQFSAPIQPGTSGGPVTSEEGQLLGVTVSSFNSKYLIEKGILPQNVNFALDARYIAQFFRKNQLKFSETRPDGDKNVRTSNDAAVAASVRVTCYQ